MFANNVKKPRLVVNINPFLKEGGKHMETFRPKECAAPNTNFIYEDNVARDNCPVSRLVCVLPPSKKR